MKIDEIATFNGWSNYATWRVNLELIDPRADDFAGYDAEELKTYVVDLLYEESPMPNLLIRDYAYAFIQNVNWYEIADHLREQYGLCKSCNEPTMDEYCTECDKENETMISYDKG